MDAVFITLLLITLANSILASFVLWHRPKAEVNRVFALTACTTALWTLTNALFRITSSLDMATLWAQVSYLSAVLLGASILHFSWTFPLYRQIPMRWKATLWITALIISSLPFIPGLIVQAIKMESIRSIDTNSGIYLIALFLIATIGWGLASFVQRHFTLHRVAREQSRFVLTGLGIAAAIGLICNLALPLRDDYRFVWLGPASSLFFVAFCVYAIIAHHLFDIRFIIKKTLVYSLLVAAVGAGYSLAEHTLTEFLRRTVENSNFAWMGNLLGALLVGIFFSPLKAWLEKQVGRLIYRNENGDRNKRINTTQNTPETT
jgi:hypothetical protein